MSFCRRVARRSQAFSTEIPTLSAYSRCSCQRGWIWLSSPQSRRFSGRCFPSTDGHGVSRQRIQTLAIETSCDDTSVAVLSVAAEGKWRRSKVLFHEKVTSNSHQYSGIHPIIALQSHQTELAGLVQKAIRTLEPKQNQHYPSNDQSSDADENRAFLFYERRPDFVSVTRGPGMRSNLNVGLNTAKGLALAWNVPLVGVNHMQAHALTPRLCATLNSGNDGTGQSLQRHDDDGNSLGEPAWSSRHLEPQFPFLGLLVSGGHTMLIDSQSLTDHRILAETQDIAIGDYLDKVARAILDESELKVPYGKALEDFAFPQAHQVGAWYKPPKRRQEELERRVTEYGWSLGPPLAESKGGEKSSRRMVYSFAGLLSAVLRLTNPIALTATNTPDIGRRAMSSLSERQELAREAQRVAFEHLGSRFLIYLEDNKIPKDHSSQSSPCTIVVSGGVASNKFLRHVLRSTLDVRGYSNVKLLFPPPELCTDNALMIAWAGMEMYDAGYESELSIESLRKWSMDAGAADGGILGVGGWKKPDRLVK